MSEDRDDGGCGCIIAFLLFLLLLKSCDIERRTGEIERGMRGQSSSVR